MSRSCPPPARSRAPRTGTAAGAATRLAAALLAAAPLAASCGGPLGPAVHDGPNVLLVVIDTLRQDRLGCYGSERDTTPNIDALAARSVRFSNAYSTAPWTAPSMASIHTGLFPAAHTFTRIGRQLPDEVHTLAEILGEAGYATWMANSNRLLMTKTGVSQGFETYNDKEARGHDHVSTTGLTNKAVRALESFAEEDRPFFASIVYFDPHYNYKPHPEFGFAHRPEGHLTGEESIHELRALGPELSDAEKQYIRDLYDEEIKHTDEGIGRLLATLDELGLADDTLVVLTADHGEEFWEHDWLGHTNNLYENLLHVPLIVHDPRLDVVGGRVVDGRVSTVSLAATVVDLVGLDAGAESFQGPSLRALLAPDPPDWSGKPIFAEVAFVPVKGHTEKKAHMRSILLDGYKLIRDDDEERFELYHLAEDPGEHRDLASEQPERVQELYEKLEVHTKFVKSAARDARETELTDEDVEMLKDLGYVDVE